MDKLDVSNYLVTKSIGTGQQGINKTIHVSKRDSVGRPPFIVSIYDVEGLKVALYEAMEKGF